MEIVQLELINEAERLGIEVDLLEDCATHHILLKKGQQEVLFGASATPLNQLSYQAFFTAGNKQYTKHLFKKLAISHPKSIVFNDIDKAIDVIKTFLNVGKYYVLKPLEGTEGRGVCMNLKNIEDVRIAWEKWRAEYKDFMLEEQVEGGDLRIQAIGGKIVAACIRKPATIMGNGVASVAELVANQQAIIKAQNPANDLVLDAASFELLAIQNLDLKSIPNEGQIVQLKYVANMNQGAVAVDVTPEIHPDYAQWIARIATELNLSIFALDVMTKDYTQKPTHESAWALEINGEPYWYHHTFSENRTHNMARMILEDAFGILQPVDL